MSGSIGTSHSKSKAIGNSLDTAKAWADISTSGNTVNASFNVSTVDDMGSGNHDVNFIVPMKGTNYAALMTFGTAEDAWNVAVVSGDRSTTEVTIWTRYLTWQGSSGNQESNHVGVAIFEE